MIDEASLLKFRNLFGDERQLEKDYLLNLMLKTISINRISNYLEFKGGTALYMLHGLDRFSEDRDFSYVGDASGIGARIDSLIEPVVKDFERSYNITKKKGNVLVKDENGLLTSIRSEFFIEGPLFAKTGKRHKIKIDISVRQDLILKPESLSFVSKYYDIGTMVIYSMPIEELLAEKLCAMMERDEARDIYDAYFMMQRKSIIYDRVLFNKKLKLRNEEYDEKQLISKIRAMKENKWKEELKYLVKDLPKLGEVKKQLIKVLTGGKSMKGTHA